MTACHFLEKHMDEVSEPSYEMVMYRAIGLGCQCGV